jgi:hypothetical protein
MGSNSWTGKQVDNTVQVASEHIFTADNELDYTSDIADTTTVTVSELPSNTVAIFVYYRVTRSGDVAYLAYKRSSGDTFVSLIDFGGFDSENDDRRGYAWLLTDSNSIYFHNLNNTCEDFKILGYKTKGAN